MTGQRSDGVVVCVMRGRGCRSGLDRNCGSGEDARPAGWLPDGAAQRINPASGARG